ncbi:MAG: 3-deoxy-manno-octulosonate cytidylyltransferase [Bacteroidetes bacterium GWF2_42_66]|nr:MAG: 3-deoxy-manno-octulosonate cytidylyltransferase [Bacteroidetes bacterium GWA2_42_15]OFY02130.1 MAG: 3-deoxy-manno-octulosonate cytidylyltransferase [Bacteroidetes bacterium GWE2_42_39]OFY43476.1 MAG: 3-deoxy-manno-octulosonate cytidylyltransferase [Bacteroidetes bacterium GWF2_42_66]HBL76563.1 3-deoxy-manno-octulosonate cytidylyltransferase [Prolixibacteraceae bacterium]HCR91098.1 3-deoxy-manno-octulosonate cytidylyltransferase [Prolixibacteraceae bacterium]
MKFIGIIPARYQSTRFPGKPLVLLNNKPVIQWVYENVSKILDDVWVATDDERIFRAVESFGGRAVYTSADHQSGTDRCAEAARKISETMAFDVVVNIQGDEPFIRTEQIERICSCFDSKEVEIATLIKPVTDLTELHNPNRPKVVVNKNMEALLFSRSTIPYVRGSKPEEWLGKTQFFSHIGMYAYRADILQELTKLLVGKLEQAESLEQLRWLENGYRIKTAITEFETIGIDTPEDLAAAQAMIG